MQVVYVSTLTGGGPVAHLRVLAPSAARAGAKVRVVCASESVAAAFRVEGLETAVVPIRSKLDAPALRSLWPHLEAADVVHTQDRRAGLFARLAGRVRAARVVHTYHGLPEEIAVRLGRPGAPDPAGVSTARIAWLRYGYLRIEAVLARLGAVVTPSRTMADYLVAHGLPRDRVRVIPHGIDLRAAESRPRHTPLVVGTAANLEYWKGIDTLIAAAARVPGPLLLEVFGEGSSRARLEEQARSLGVEARFHGSVGDLRSQLPDLDVFVLPSRAENFPMSLLEAMAAAVPVVATRVGGVPELVEDGRTGLLVEPDDPRALGQALESLATDEDARRRLAAGGAERARTEFDADAMGRRVVALYEELCAFSR